METFSSIKNFVSNPNFEQQRSKSLKKLNYKDIDKPIVDIIKQINDLSFCFTLQCCYGHFLYLNQKDTHNIEPLPRSTNITSVEYRIAYIAICLQNNEKGHNLFTAMKDMVKIDPKNIQFGCADWFWQQHLNSFILQVEPERYKMYDTATLDYEEALKIEAIRNNFFSELNKMLNVI
jgi:hypothetical protein